ncbi:PAS domain S-box protein [Lacibacterium aquatile]|uniref:histidine kinase n=1 Tax=Lacibacterium aquatile TaxID=1168082 RepID=A0ABW5DWD6_9PROT
MLDPLRLPCLIVTPGEPIVVALGKGLAPEIACIPPGTHLADLWETQDESPLGVRIAAASAEGATLDVLNRTDGHRLRLQPLEDDGRFILIVTDIGDLQTALKEAETQRDRYLYTSLATRDGTFDFDVQTGKVWRAPRLLAQLGYQPGELGDDLKTWYDLVDPEDVAAGERLTADMVSGEIDHLDVVQRFRHKDGTWVWILVRAIAVRDDKGRLLRICGTHSDLTERRRLEQAWAAAELQLRDAIEAMRDGFVLFDAEGQLVLCNGRYLDMFPRNRAAVRPGVTYEEILRLDVEAGDYADAPSTAEERETWIINRMKQIREATGTLEVKRSDGRILQLQQYRTPDGGWVGIRTDVTLLRQREMQLRMQTELLEAVLNIMPLHVVIRDEAGAIIHINHNSLDFVGKTASEVIGKTARQIYDPDLTQQIEENDRRALAGEILDWTASDHVDRHGGTKSFLHYIRVERVGGRRVVIASSLDVTDRRAAERALADSEARFRDIVEGSIQGVLIVKEHKVLFANPAFARMFGYDSPSAVVDIETVGLLVDGDTRMRIDAAWEQIREGAATVELPQLLARRADGSHAWLDAYLRRIIWNRRSAMQFTVVDVTQRTLAVEELLRSRSDLENQRTKAEMANRAKSQFLAVMSHELRTPMTGVLGMVDLLLDSPLSDEQRAQVLTLRSSAEALLTLLDDLLDLSKIEAEQLELERIDFDLVPLVQDVAQLFRNRAADRGTALTVDLPEDLPRILKGDPTRLRQILLNLIGNAVKFTEGGTVAIKVRVISGEPGLNCLRFEVSDTGIGIPREQQMRLFQPFMQADASTTRRFGGTGLGLAISRRLVEAMQGEIGVISEPGQGASFWFIVPGVEGDPAAVQTARRPAAPVAHIAPMRILLAEDNEINRSLVVTMLKRRGHQVTAVENGRLAVDAALSEPFDIVILDIQMPVMDGATAARHIRNAPQPTCALPLIALTADVMPEHRESYFAAGLDRILPKPVDWHQLDATIAELTGQAPTEGHATVDWNMKPLLSDATIARLTEMLGPLGVEELWQGMVDSIDVAAGRLRRALDTHDWTAWQMELGSLARLAEQLGAPRLSAIARTPLTAEERDSVESLLNQLRHVAGDTESAWRNRARDRRKPH